MCLNPAGTRTQHSVDVVKNTVTKQKSLTEDVSDSSTATNSSFADAIKKAALERDNSSEVNEKTASNVSTRTHHTIFNIGKYVALLRSGVTMLFMR